MEQLNAATPSQHVRKPRVVFLGDSLTQGTQDGYTVSDRQEHGWAQVLCRSIGIEPNAGFIGQPGVPFNVFTGNTLDTGTLANNTAAIKKAVGPLAAVVWYAGAPPIVPPVWRQAGMGVRTPESKNSEDHPQNNFAVPGFKSRHIRDVATTHDVVQEMHSGLIDAGVLADQAPNTMEILQNSDLLSHGTSVDQAVKADPDLIMLWGGNNDSLHGDLVGYIDDVTLTPLKDQKYTYKVTNPVNGQVETRTTPHKLPGMESLYIGKDGIVPRLLHDTDADIFMMTIPQIEVTPSMSNVGEKIGPLPFKILLPNGTDVTQFVENFTIPTAISGPGKNGRTVFPPGSKVSWMTVLGKLSSAAPADTGELQAHLKSFAQTGFLTEDQVADPDEQTIVHDRTDQFNDVFRKAAAMSPRIHLIDTSTLLEDVKDKGRKLKGEGPDVTVTSIFTGVQKNGMEGIFSHDGVHPSDTGYAVLSNYILSQMQKKLAGDPRFEAIEHATPVDEKAVFAQDPHRGKQMAVVLDPACADAYHQMVR